MLRNPSNRIQGFVRRARVWGAHNFRGDLGRKHRRGAIQRQLPVQLIRTRLQAHSASDVGRARRRNAGDSCSDSDDIWDPRMSCRLHAAFA